MQTIPRNDQWSLVARRLRDFAYGTGVRHAESLLSSGLAADDVRRYMDEAEHGKPDLLWLISPDIRFLASDAAWCQHVTSARIMGHVRREGYDIKPWADWSERDRAQWREAYLDAFWDGFQFAVDEAGKGE